MASLPEYPSTHDQAFGYCVRNCLRVTERGIVQFSFMHQTITPSVVNPQSVEYYPHLSWQIEAWLFDCR